MASVAGIPRSRGGVCGLLLIILGAWGGLIPFVGPYFHYAFTPDRTWAYTTGRLYLEVVPGAVVLLSGLIVLATRSRALGGMAAFLAGLGGAWFVAGTGVIETWGTQLGHITPGTPVATSATKALLEVLGFFTGLGVVIVFFAALALGRFSLIAARDAADAGLAADYGSDLAGPTQFPASQPDRPAGQDPFPTTTGQFPSATGQYPTTTGQFPASQPRREAGQDPFPTTSGQYPTTSGQFPPPEQFPPSDPFPPSTS
jgi:hypothetical protein